MTSRPILVATDLSESADAAVRRAAEIAAQRPDARLIVASVSNPHAFRAPQAVLAEETSVSDALAERLQALLPGREFETRVLEDHSPARAICALAEEVDASLVVVGSHGRSGVERFLLGSVAERVVRHCVSDVWVVRAR